MKESRNQESTYTIYFQASEIYQTDKFLIVSNITEIYSVSKYLIALFLVIILNYIQVALILRIR
jgi:hypothetical protein